MGLDNERSNPQKLLYKLWRAIKRLNVDLFASHKDYSGSGIDNGLRGMIKSGRSVRKLIK